MSSITPSPSLELSFILGVSEGGVSWWRAECGGVGVFEGVCGWV